MLNIFFVRSILCFILVLGLSFARVDAASLIHTQDFEDTDWADDFSSGTSNVARVTNHPHGGSYCIRGNLWASVSSDPIAGVAGQGNTQLEYREGISSALSSTGKVFVRYWRRFDNATWSPGDVNGYYGKSEYICDTSVGTSAFYTRMQSGTNMSAISSNGAYDSFCTTDWGGLKGYITNSQSFTDGQWHYHDIYFDSATDTIRLWIDGVEQEGRGSTTSYFTSPIPVPSTFTLRGLQLLYASSSQLASSSNGGTGEYACGYQFDDIQVWDGIPTASTPEVSSATINGSTAQITFDQDLDDTAFANLINGDLVFTGTITGASDLESCSENNGVVSCTADASFVYGETVTLSSSGLTGDEICDGSENCVSSISGESVTNNTAAAATTTFSTTSGAGFSTTSGACTSVAGAAVASRSGAGTSAKDTSSDIFVSLGNLGLLNRYS